MAKRFIDTDLFRKPFMRALEAPYKALWIYLLCECDHAGVWTVELDVAQLRMDMKLDPEKALEKLGGAAIPIDGGAKWFLPDFVGFQYGILNPANRVHESVIAILDKYGIDLNEIQENKGLGSPLQGAKDKDKDKEIVNSEKKGRRKKNEPPPQPEEPIALIWPKWAGPKTIARWEAFKAYRWKDHRVRYKSLTTEQAAINLLAKYYTSGKECVDDLDYSTGKQWRFPVDPAERGFGTRSTQSTAPVEETRAPGWQNRAPQPEPAP